jgi:IS605 OrfB family transposase
MRTVKRESVKLNKAKFEAIEKIARAFASDKQAHLDFYQDGLNFSGAKSYRQRRNELKSTGHHASTPLSVHASDLAVKEAFDAEVKYWAARAAEIRPRIGSRQWSDEQKHYGFWLLYDERRFSSLILGRAPKIVVTEKLDFRGKAKSKDISRRVSYWHRSTLKERFEFKASAAGCRREQINPAYTSQTCPECGHLEKANRKGDVFQCLKCEHRGHADQIAAINQKSRYFDRRITLYTPKEEVKRILLEDYNARLEHRNASSSDEKIRTMTVPGQTLERDKEPETKSSRQSKNETATGKSTKSVVIR